MEQTKVAINVRDHGVSFEEASTVFDDPLSEVVSDPDHSIGEYRWIIIGTSDQSRLLIVSFTERGDATRMISARETCGQSMTSRRSVLPTARQAGNIGGTSSGSILMSLPLSLMPRRSTLRFANCSPHAAASQRRSRESDVKENPRPPASCPLLLYPGVGAPKRA